MDEVAIFLLGLIAGFITSFGFIPQLIRGYRTKKLEDVSYFLPLVLSIGMSLWLVYGIFIEEWPVIFANALGISFCLSLMVMKKKYSSQSSTDNKSKRT